MFLSSVPNQNSFSTKWIIIVIRLMAGAGSRNLTLNVYNSEPYYNCAVCL